MRSWESTFDSIEVQLGSWILHGQFHELSLDAVEALSLTSVLAELAVGSTVLGVLLGAMLGAATFRLAKALSGDEFRNLLIERTAQAYLPSGFMAWERVRAKLRFDGTYVNVIRQGLIPAHGTLVDASSGPGVLLALTSTYSNLARNREQPGGWPSLPSALNLVGFVSTEKEERIARSALRGGAKVERRDLREGTFPACEAFVLFDVLHRYSADEQAGILDRATAALKPSGVLLIRHRCASGSENAGTLEHEVRRRGLVVRDSRASRVFFSRRHLLVAQRDDCDSAEQPDGR